MSNSVCVCVCVCCSVSGTATPAADVDVNGIAEESDGADMAIGEEAESVSVVSFSLSLFSLTPPPPPTPTHPLLFLDTVETKEETSRSVFNIVHVYAPAELMEVSCLHCDYWNREQKSCKYMDCTHISADFSHGQCKVSAGNPMGKWNTSDKV